MTTESTETLEPITLGPDADVTNVRVDLNGASAGSLYVWIDGELDNDDALPATSDPDNSRWIEPNGYGCYFGWQDSLPVSEETGARSYEIEHESAGTVERYRMHDHVIKDQCENKGHNVVTIRYIDDSGFTRSVVIDTKLAQKLIDYYVNGPLGSDDVSYWAYKRRESWRSYDAKYEDDIYCGVALVEDRNYSWLAKNIRNITDEHTVYEA